MVSRVLFSKPRILILAHLRDNGKTRFSEIKKELKIPSDGNLAWHIKVLQKFGYVKSIHVDGNKRLCIIKPTSKGMRSLDNFNDFIKVLIPS